MNLLRWKTKENPYNRYEAGYLCRYVAFTLRLDGMTNKRDPNKYKLRCKLNGIKDDLGSFESEQLAMEKAEVVLSEWMSRSGLTIK